MRERLGCVAEVAAVLLYLTLMTALVYLSIDAL